MASRSIDEICEEGEEDNARVEFNVMLLNGYLNQPIGVNIWYVYGLYDDVNLDAAYRPGNDSSRKNNYVRPVIKFKSNTFLEYYE